MKNKLFFIVGIIVCSNSWGMENSEGMGGMYGDNSMILQNHLNNPFIPQPPVEQTASAPLLGLGQEYNGQNVALYPSILDNPLVQNLTDDERHSLCIGETQKRLKDVLEFVRNNTNLPEQIRSEISKIEKSIKKLESVAKDKFDEKCASITTRIMSLRDQEIRVSENPVPEKYINLPTWPRTEKFLNHKVSCAQLVQLSVLAILGFYGWSKNVFSYLGYAGLLAITWVPIIIQLCEMTSYEFAVPITQFVAASLLCGFTLISMRMKARK